MAHKREEADPRGLLTCPLRAEGSSEAGRCGWCSAILHGRRTVWCSDECRQRFLDNHYWSDARRGAILRAGGYAEWVCARCGGHTEWPASPEVNHIVPRVGAGYAEGCWHHQSGLEVLCHPCHVETTTLQIRSRLPARPGRAASLPLWGSDDPGAAGGGN